MTCDRPVGGAVKPGVCFRPCCERKAAALSSSATDGKTDQQTRQKHEDDSARLVAACYRACNQRRVPLGCESAFSNEYLFSFCFYPVGHVAAIGKYTLFSFCRDSACPNPTHKFRPNTTCVDDVWTMLKFAGANFQNCILR